MISTGRPARLLPTGVVLMVIVSGLAGCAAVAPGSGAGSEKMWADTMRQVSFDRTARPIPEAELVTRGVRLESYGNRWDSEWSVRGGESFAPPFSVYWWGDQRPSISPPYEDEYETAWQAGARQVRIHVAGRDEPLYGLIVFNDSVESTCGPARESYYMQIAQDKIRAASDGDIAVAYENVLFVPEQFTCKQVAASVRHYEAQGVPESKIYGEHGPFRHRPTWMLWLYDEPLLD